MMCLFLGILIGALGVIAFVLIGARYVGALPQFEDTEPPK